MISLKRSLALFASSVVFMLSVLLPSFASAQTYPYDNYQYNCGWYGNQNCPNQLGTLLVYVQVSNNSQYYNGYGYRSPSDFTVFVSGANISQQQFQGSQNGNSIRLLGAYSVTILNPDGYSPSYSVGCNNTVVQGQTQTCIVSLTPTNNYYSPTYYPSYPQYQPTVTYVATYVPSLPNTGFKPFDVQSIAFGFILLLVAGILALPYVRKSITALTR